jgi:hypothetical protein
VRLNTLFSFFRSFFLSACSCDAPSSLLSRQHARTSVSFFKIIHHPLLSFASVHEFFEDYSAACDDYALVQRLDAAAAATANERRQHIRRFVYKMARLVKTTNGA